MPVFSLNPARAAVRALNALLSREPWARERLRAQAGKTVRLTVGSGPGLSLTVAGTGGVEAAAADAVPDVTLAVAAGKLPDLLSNDAGRRMGAVRIEGDAALAQVVGELARDLRWDAEDELAGLVGDIPAARLTAAAGRVRRGLRDGAWRLAENLAEYLVYESGSVASAPAVQAWMTGVDQAREAAERTAPRLAQLQARLARLEARG